MKNLARLIAIASLSWLLAACQSASVLHLYEGPELPDSAVLTVHIPEQLEVLAINGRAMERGYSLFTTSRELKLVPGEYRIEAYYKELWETSVESHDVYRSDPVTFVVDGQAGERYELSYEAPANAEESKRLAENFSGWAENLTTGERRPTTGSKLSRPGLFGSLGGSSTEASTAVAPIDSSTPAARPEPASPSNNSADTSYLDLLKAYWSQASSDERREFLRWIAE